MFAVVLAMALAWVAADVLMYHFSTASPTTTNTLAYRDHGKTIYISPHRALWNSRLMFAFYIAFGATLILAVGLTLRERNAKPACPQNPVPAYRFKNPGNLYAKPANTQRFGCGMWIEVAAGGSVWWNWWW